MRKQLFHAFATACALALAISASVVATSDASATGLANLVLNTARVQSSISFKTQSFTTKDCAYVEQSLTGTGKRTLMRFDVSAANRGSAAMVLGNPVGNPLFQYSACHRHYHFSGYALYELFRSDPSWRTTSEIRRLSTLLRRSTRARTRGSASGGPTRTGAT